jgi:hypothetical protein
LIEIAVKLGDLLRDEGLSVVRDSFGNFNTFSTERDHDSSESKPHSTLGMKPLGSVRSSSSLADFRYGRLRLSRLFLGHFHRSFRGERKNRSSLSLEVIASYEVRGLSGPGKLIVALFSVEF